MGITERYAVIYQIVSGIGRIGESVLSACLHDFFIKCHGRDHAGKQSQAAFHGIDGIKGQLLIFLHVLVVC